MSLKLLEDSWEQIHKKVIIPLWLYKFEGLYRSVKMDISDFESLADEELTKAFKKYNEAESNIFTYARTVLTRKALSEIRDKKRQKRCIDTYADSIYKKFTDDADGSLEDTIEKEESISEKNMLEAEECKNAILTQLKSREVKIINLLVEEVSPSDIATALHIKTKEVLDVKKKVANNSSIRRIARIYGYLKEE